MRFDGDDEVLVYRIGYCLFPMPRFLRKPTTQTSKKLVPSIMYVYVDVCNSPDTVLPAYDSRPHSYRPTLFILVRGIDYMFRAQYTLTSPIPYIQYAIR